MSAFIVTALFGAKYQTARRRAAFVLYMLIVALGSIPHARAEIGQLASGLVLHSIAYSLISFLLFTGWPGNRLRKSIWAILIVAVMGALDEYVQSFLPYRTAAASDWLVDCSASILTVVLLLLLIRRHDSAAP